METKKSKYDTNPLDPEVGRKTEEVWGEDGDVAATGQIKGATREVGSANESARANVYSEAPTRRYDNARIESSYPSVFIPPPYSPPAYQQPNQQPYQAPSNRRPSHRAVEGIGFSEKWASALPYAPYVGIVASVIELLLVPRKEIGVRFHAAQGLSLQLAILIIERLFWIIGALTGNSFGGSLFRAVSLAFLIISMIRVFKGEPHKIAPLTEPGQWFNQRIEPRTKS